MIVMNEILKMLAKMDKKQLDEAIVKAREFANSPDGKKVMEKLSRGETIEGIPVPADQQGKLLSELSKNPDAMKKIAEILGNKG